MLWVSIACNSKKMNVTVFTVCVCVCVCVCVHACVCACMRTILRVEVEEKKKTSFWMKEASETSQSSMTETVVSLIEHIPWDDCRERKLNVFILYRHLIYHDT